MTNDTAENEESSSNPPPGLWATVKYAYDSLVRTVIRPQRSNYTTEDLGPTTCLLARNLVVGRQDITLRNDKGLAVECSWWRRKSPPTETPKKEPCIVVLHGNSSCRLGCMDILFHGLAAGFTVFALDFSGSGMSEGKYVSLGYHEKRDIDLVLAYLRESNHVSNIVLWGRSMGAVAALLCAQEDHDITALVLDSPFSCLKQLALDLVDDGKLNVPKFAVSIVMRVLRRDIKRRAKFDMFKLNPIASMDKCMAPSFFAVGEQDELVAPKHVENLYAAHRGPKQLYKFVGGHNSPRPAAFYHEAINFCRVMCGQLPIPQLPDDEMDDDPFQLVEQAISHEELSSKSIRELKKILNDGGIDNSLLGTIVEKSELVDLVLKLQERRLKLAMHQRRHSDSEDMETTSLSGLERRYSTGSDGISLDNIRPELNDLKPAGRKGAKGPMASLDDNFFYGPNDLIRTQLHGEMPRDLFYFVAMRGLDTRRRNNLLYLEEHLILTAAGNTAQLLDPYAQQQTYLFGYSGGGIGALAVHPKRSFFAIGEKGVKPHICIYTYPDVKLYRVLRNGTERGYSSLRFSEDGTKLASVGAAPDFLLTVWNWMGEQMILRCKAFGQEVFNVQFAPNDNGFLTTSGTGHIRFWKMASTFTGLKLQGDIGKFGKSELSDIEAFCVLPDKKVLSSTERGALLLWDGNFIKCEIVQGNRQRAHNGPINVIMYEPERKQIVTAGTDGTIKWWHFQDIDQADVKEDDTVALVEPKEVVNITTKTLHHTTAPADIRGLVRGLDHYLIQDGHGLLHRYDTETKLVTQLMECHAGAISGIGTSPCEHICATCGIDGAVTCWDYTTGTSLYTSRFNTGATALAYAPQLHDIQGKTVAVAFQDGVIRILERGPTTWHRVHVFKPHNQPITCMAYSPDGRYFVSASQDNTAFIFQCPSLGKYEPVGFKSFASGQTVRHLSWRMDSRAILFTCLNGIVGEVEIPSIYDEERSTYELDAELKTFTFRRTRKLTSNELSQMLSEPTTDKLTSYNLAANPTGSALGFGEVEVAPEAPAFIQAAVYCCVSSSCFLVSVGGAHAGQLYKCLWGKTYPMDNLPDDPTGLVQSFTRSYSGKFLLCGNANGKVQIRASLTPFAFLNLELHDQATSGTSAAALAFDDSFLVSGGSDGQLVVTRLQSQKILTTAENMTERHAMKLTEAKKVYQTAHDQLAAKNDVRQQGDGSEPAANLFMHNPIFAGALAYMQFLEGVTVTEAEELQGVVQLLEKAAEGTFGAVLSVDLSIEPQVNRKEAPDITNREAYTIQDAKLKLEADIRANSALAKKNRTRAIIAEMQDEFRRLQVLDSTHEPMARLEEHLWNIDPEYGTMLLANGDKQCEEVRKEMAYLYEQSELLLGKMRRKYVGNLAVELITLHGFQNGLYVQSFRTLRMSDELQDRLRLIHLELQEAQKNQKARDDKRTVLDFVHKPKSDNQPEDADKSKHNSTRSVEEVAQSSSDGAGPSSHRFEYRKLMRAQRKARIQAWESKKPREDADDPRDVAAIAFANTHMEDYKLKTSANYVVPEEQRVNAMKKRKQMALLEEKMYDITMNFNAKVLELRELKHRLVEQIQEDTNLLESLERKVKTESSTQRTKWSLPNMTPLLDLHEWPEQRERVLDNHIEEYQKKGTITSAHLTTLEAVHHANDREVVAVHPLLESKSMEQSTHYALSQLEEEENHIEMIKVKRQIEFLQHKIIHAIQAFDEAIYRLRREKMKLDIALKKGEIKLMTRLGELVLLEQFESKENLLVSKLEKCKADKAQVVQELTECNDQLILKRKELEEWQTNEGVIQTDFINLVGQMHPSFALLQKIFKKRLKRIKKRNTDDMDEEEEEESEEEYNSDDDDDDNDSNEEETCPSGCDMALYEKVLALREKKADIDDAMSEITKSIDELKRSNDRQIQKQRQIDKELTATEQDIQTFQTEKQMRFNELDVVVALSKLQLRCLETRQTPDGTVDYLLPETVENSLIFNNSVIQRLSGRILSLQDENKALRQVFKDLHKQQSQLLRDKSRQNEVISAVRDKCEQLQLLKFGQLIDIDVLDKACDTGNLNELKAKVRAKEIHTEKQSAQSKSEQQRLKLEILQATEDNTRLLTEIAALSERHFALESELNQADVNNTLIDDSVQLEREMSERKKLVELVKLQSREIEALKQEVLMLRGRKGRVHAPMQ